MSFRLRKSSTPTQEPAPAEPAADPGRGKGRATPKRRDVVGPRGPVSAPRTRKEAYARQKANARAAQSATRAGTGSQPMTPAQRRLALKSGEMLVRRDQGPAKALARDYVDSHRMMSNYLLLVVPLFIAATAVQNVSSAAKIAQLAMVALLLVLLVEWVMVGRMLRKMTIERNGSCDSGAFTLGYYAGSRAFLPRRWRIPSPRVQRGDTI